MIVVLGDALRLVMSNPAAAQFGYTLNARGLSPDGTPWLSLLSATSDATGNVSRTLTIPIGELVELSLAATNDRFPYGSYGEVTLVANSPGTADVVTRLCSGAVGAESIIRYSASGISDSPGAQILGPAVLIVADPAGGSDWSAAVPAEDNWHLTRITARLVTDANVGNRIVSLRTTINGVVVAIVAAGPAHPASTDRVYVWSDYKSATTLPTGWQALLMPPLDLPQASTLSVVTTALQAGDQWSEIHLVGTLRRFGGP